MSRLLFLFSVCFALSLAGKLGQKVHCGEEDRHTIGPCIQDSCTLQGYSCDDTKSLCCPAFDPSDKTKWLGPSVGGKCPAGSTVVYGLPGENYSIGTCVSLPPTQLPYSYTNKF